MTNKIDTVSSRQKLEPRRDPYWMALGDVEGAYIGFRRGPDTWVARLRADGVQRFHAVGRHEDHRAAIRAAKDWIKSIEQGVVDHTATVRDACNAYIANRQGEKNRTAALDVSQRLQRCVLGRKFKTRQTPAHSLARIPLAKLRPDHLEKWRDELIPADLKGDALRKIKASANRNMTALVAALNYAYKRRMVSSDFAWSAVAKFGDVQARKHRRYINAEERKELLNAATGAVRDLIEGLTLTGARPVELARLTVADYDPASGTICLTSYKGRSTEPRRRDFPLRALGAEALVKRLCKRKFPTAPIFARDDGRAWGHSDWDHLVRYARDKAGLKGVTAYDLRHTFITEALTGGVDPMTVSRLVGTSLQMITTTYGKLVESHATQAFRTVKLL